PREPSIRQATRYSSGDIWMTWPSGRRTSDGGWLYPESRYSPISSTPSASSGAGPAPDPPAGGGRGAVCPVGTCPAATVMVCSCLALTGMPGVAGRAAGRRGCCASGRAAQEATGGPSVPPYSEGTAGPHPVRAGQVLAGELAGDRGGGLAAAERQDGDGVAAPGRC